MSEILRAEGLQKTFPPFCQAAEAGEDPIQDQGCGPGFVLLRSGGGDFWPPGTQWRR